MWAHLTNTKPARLTLILHTFKGNPELLAYIDFIYSTFVKLCQLNQSNLLLKSLHGPNLRFISHNLRPLSSWHGQLQN